MAKRKTLMYSLASVTLAAFLMTACSSSDATDSSASSAVETTLTSEEEAKLTEATEAYREFVEEQIDQLLADTEDFAELLKDGKLEEAKAQYPLIRMAYERSEPIAESFGELDIKIDYRLVDYVDENNSEDGWTGYHRIERILWEDNTTDGTEEYAEQLVNDIKELRAKVSTVEVTPDMMTTGAVDLLNEVATSKITGEEEIYSHTDLYDFRANIEGAEKIFELFKELIEAKDPDLVTELEDNFKTVNDLLDSYMTDDENYVSYEELTNDDTKKLSEAVTKLGEPLSQMGIILG